MPTVEAKITPYNRNAGGMHEVEWVIIHNTANSQSYEGMAKNNADYFYNNDLSNTDKASSAHYFIDDGDTVWQSVPETDRAWHIGDGASRNGAYNYNSIGIETCEPSWGEFTDNEKETLRWLVRDLMERYNVDADHVVRHYDVTYKNCPWYYVGNDEAWEELHEYITSEGDDKDMATPREIWGYMNETLDSKDMRQRLVDTEKSAANALKKAKSNESKLAQVIANQEKIIKLLGGE